VPRGSRARGRPRSRLLTSFGREPERDIDDGPSYIDWADLSGLDQVVTVYGIGDSVLVVETSDGRQIRIAAWRDLRANEYVADFERRGNVKSGARDYHVWAQTSAYGRVTGKDLQSCLEAAVLAVDRIHVY
jgi:hypothetical protein